MFLNGEDNIIYVCIETKSRKLENIQNKEIQCSLVTYECME